MSLLDQLINGTHVTTHERYIGINVVSEGNGVRRESECEKNERMYIQQQHRLRFIVRLVVSVLTFFSKIIGFLWNILKKIFNFVRCLGSSLISKIGLKRASVNERGNRDKEMPVFIHVNQILDKPKNDDTYQSYHYDNDTELNLLPNPSGLHSKDALVKQPLWAYKQKKFWQCGKSSIWRTWIMYLWYVSLIFFAFQIYRIHYGGISENIKLSTVHNIHKNVDKHETPSPWSSSFKYLAIYSDWSQPEYYDDADRFMFEKFDVKQNDQGNAIRVEPRSDNIFEDSYYRYHILPGDTEPEYFVS